MAMAVNVAPVGIQKPWAVTVAPVGIRKPLKFSNTRWNYKVTTSLLRYASESSAAKVFSGFPSPFHLSCISPKPRVLSRAATRNTGETLNTVEPSCVAQFQPCQETSSKLLLATAVVFSGAILALTGSLTEKFAALLLSKLKPNIQSLASLKGSFLSSYGALFFADRAATPLTVVAAAMQKWLELYGVLLTARILLSWFPNIPWDRQPFLAMRDLSDPYLALFRNIIPPIKNALDVSPMLAFAILGFFRFLLDNAL
eukprot:TRINITY_DN1308_c0_g1_i2.p1 TRINITY_DN1308_c0_g1~~TRINITY_DN1308_c0_g1_i2.p1  ORF type:complete len:256 (+),score=13.24 TRINITY_DN1308_c0_g1_i2:220-987(+)